jgi:hypothetical protein
LKIWPRLRSGLIFGILLFCLVSSTLLAYRLVSGRRLGLRSFLSSGAHTYLSVVKSLANQQLVREQSTGTFTNLIFLHHSVGSNLIDQGNVRELLTQAGYSFWDHGYNYQGLRNPAGKAVGYSYNIVGDNTDPDGLARLFVQPVYRLPLNAFSSLLQHEVIIIKSCYPTSNISSEAQFSQYQTWYLTMRVVMGQHPDKIFILVTQPPLNPAVTELETAARARHFADWLASPEFLKGHPNVFTFNFFDLLAEKDPTASDANMLRLDYRQGTDSHPNRLAHESIGPVFVDFVIQAINKYKSHSAYTGSR